MVPKTNKYSVPTHSFMPVSVKDKYPHVELITGRFSTTQKKKKITQTKAQKKEQKVLVYPKDGFP